MNEDARLADQWPLLVTCAGFILMGVFVIGAADEWFGWVFVVFGAAVILWTLGRTAVEAARSRRG